MTRTDVLIAGAGPVGLVSALALARRGVEQANLFGNIASDQGAVR